MTATSPQDQLIEAATDLFHAEYWRLQRPGMDEVEHDDCVRGGLEAVIALVQGEKAEKDAAVEALRAEKDFLRARVEGLLGANARYGALVECAEVYVRAGLVRGYNADDARQWLYDYANAR